jgi:hypothetical protein
MSPKSKEIRRFKIIPVDVIEDGQIINLDYKLPAHLVSCKGIILSIKNCISNTNDIPHLGEVSLLLNSGQVHPFHQMVGFKRESLSKKNSFVEIDEKLIPNYTVNGFYRDLGNSLDHEGKFIPYSLNIYLDCLASE